MERNQFYSGPERKPTKIYVTEIARNAASYYVDTPGISEQNCRSIFKELQSLVSKEKALYRFVVLTLPESTNHSDLLSNVMREIFSIFTIPLVLLIQNQSKTQDPPKLLEDLHLKLDQTIQFKSKDFLRLGFVQHDKRLEFVQNKKLEPNLMRNLKRDLKDLPFAYPLSPLSRARNIMSLIQHDKSHF